MRFNLNIPITALLQDSDVRRWVEQTSNDSRPNQYQVKIEGLRTALSMLTGERAVYFTLRYLLGGTTKYSRGFKAQLSGDPIVPTDG